MPSVVKSLLGARSKKKEREDERDAKTNNVCVCMVWDDAVLERGLYQDSFEHDGVCSAS